MRNMFRAQRAKGVQVSLLLLWLAAGAAFPAASQEPDKEELKARLEALEKRLQELERQQVPESTAGKPAETASAEPEDLTVTLQELRRQLDVLAEEVEKLRSGEEEREVTPEQARSLGLGPSAASIYRKSRGVSIAGYGEMLYENFDASDQSGRRAGKGSQLDFLRHILYTGFRFNDRFLFNSEVEVEHANEISVEFAYLDYLINQNLTLRGGMVLIPMGLVNEFHEPNVFLGARRSETETRIIPSTWRENGFGLVGSFGKVDFRTYLVNGLDAGGFSAAGLRGGRQKGSRARASGMAWVGRVDVTPTPGFFFGASFYRGDSAHGQFSVDGRELEVGTTLGELHAQLQMRGWDLRGLYAWARLDDVAGLNRARGLSGASSIGSTLEGGFVQLGYNVLSGWHEQFALTPYYRFEKVDTQKEVPLGFERNPARDGTFHTLGLELRPIHNIVVKGDYQWIRNRAESGLNQFNIGLGYSF